MSTVDHTKTGKSNSPGDRHNLPGPVRTIVVEFVGPTGSGKTTNCQSFSALLNTMNMSVAVFADLKAYFYRMKFYRRLRVILVTLRLHGPDFFAFAGLLASHGAYSFDSVFRYIKLCVFNTALQDFVRTQKVDIVLLDQWIIQGLWSATILKLKSYGDLETKLKRFYFNTDYVLYFDVDVATASARIEARDTGKSRFDTMTAERRLVEFEKYNGYLFQLYKNSSCENKHVFSTRESPARNAEVFLSTFMNQVT